ncbi:VOC family protein [Ketobacter sp. MCCC 1A13808]|uniref:VOC family protein n=1 Tax=Ketobacter sp. MCCC 1A13808 TaxID=2602738 RepID=UPI000F274D84|nr:VOC family protein [Ketobacter sp. MCCC 1A13808]MVF14220.1 VOC family protein [Ketobacter sp. MCCC 1A13808]RLP54125.1 MAG: VOC family protein [Ketobacter sp.]
MSQSTQGLHHLGLTVKDVIETSTFFCEQLNFKVVGEKPDYPAIFVSDGTIMLTLWQAKGDSPTVPFDRHCNIGLHHFALKVANKQSLELLNNQLENHEGVNIEFKPEPLGQTNTLHMMCTIPGGIRIEFITLS